MKKYFFLICLIFILIGNVFSQNNITNDNWKNNLIYTSVWAGYGSGFSMGIGADFQLSKVFALGIESGLVDKSYPALSLLPKLSFRPWNMEITLVGGIGFGYSQIYNFILGTNYGIDIGYNFGPGVLFANFRNGLGYSFGIGYKLGFLEK